MATNDITGDEIRSKVNSDKFRSGWDAIFGKKEDKPETDVDEEMGVSADGSSE